MNSRDPLPQSDRPASRALSSSFGDARRYWEPRRALYNLVLVLVCVGWGVATWPHFRPALTLLPLLQLAALGLIANAFYCAAYFVDVPMLLSPFRDEWRRWRAGLWWAGMLLATLLTNYWIADEIYPFVR